MPYIENSDNPIVDLSYNFGVRDVKQIIGTLVKIIKNAKL